MMTVYDLSFGLKKFNRSFITLDKAIRNAHIFNFHQILEEFEERESSILGQFCS